VRRAEIYTGNVRYVL